ncbi:MAG: peptidoglycan bridge formation glycyltransferase FemA/FemB family protein [Candidatus Levybacteria bacterium]|nr:peptidoglycan bridge formation glycyltransferase FemA/FemB family protein [Candidatus Levybacteria bacterium]
MEIIDITSERKDEYNAVVSHPLQSFEWGEFRKKTGVKVVRRGFVKNNKIIDGFTLTLHNVPKTNFTIGYLPKGNNPTNEIISELLKIGEENNCIFIQLEPNILNSQKLIVKNSNLIKSFHPLFTKFTFVLDISKNEEELLKNFHSKTRYNIKVAQKHNVVVSEKNSDKDFKEYLKLTNETTTRQKFFAHTPTYHTKMWETLKNQNSKNKNQNSLSAHLLTAEYDGKTLASWVLFVFHDTLYYPYGASASENRNVMASNLIMWEAIKFGKKMDLKYFDMWGALEKEADSKDPWYGFHKFKEGYGAVHTEFAGSLDLVIKPNIYKLYKVADKLRWLYLRLKK